MTLKSYPTLGEVIGLNCNPNDIMFSISAGLEVLCKICRKNPDLLPPGCCQSIPCPRGIINLSVYILHTCMHIFTACLFHSMELTGNS